MSEFEETLGKLLGLFEREFRAELAATTDASGHLPEGACDAILAHSAARYAAVFDAIERRVEEKYPGGAEILREEFAPLRAYMARSAADIRRPN